MYKIRVSFKQKDLNVFEKLRNYSSSKNDNISKNLKLKKCLVFSKFSRYDYERYFLSKSPQNDLEFEKKVRSKGLNYDRLVEYKTMNSKFEEKVTNCLKELGIEVQVVNRLSCNTKLIEWADIIIPTGGDGTFLLAASQITDNKKIIVGFNSDPNHSEGHLCLPKKFSVNIKEAIKNLQTGNFRWLMRSRIRTKLTAQTFGKPVDLHRMNNDNLLKFNPENGTEVTLPVLALNEVFVGESLSAKASTLDINLDDSNVFTRIKSSGVCITTGTGSTSWYYSMNRLAPDYISILLRLLKSKIGNPELLENNNSLCSELADIYNKSLIFNADDKRMAYTVRDMIVAGVWPSPKGIQPRNFAKKVRLQSLCYDAGLVIDGNISFPFNNNAKATFEIHDEDALRTVIMNP